MLALCLMLSLTHHGQNYAGIIGGPLAIASIPSCAFTIQTLIHVYKVCVVYCKYYLCTYVLLYIRMLA